MLTPGRIGDRDRAGHKADIRAKTSQGRGNGVALLARRAIGDVAHGVDRLVRRTRRDDDPAAGERPGPRVEQPFDRGDDFQRFGHASGAGLAALGHLADVRSDEEDAVLLQLRAVAPGRGVRPHSRVHRRRHQHRLVGRQKHRGCEIVGEAAGELGHQIGGGRRDDDQIGFARQPDMADIMLVLAVEEIGEDMVWP